MDNVRHAQGARRGRVVRALGFDTRTRVVELIAGNPDAADVIRRAGRRADELFRRSDVWRVVVHAVGRDA